MPSPFPGMNPYLEQKALWRGFHNTFLVYLRAALTPLVTPRYYIEVEESLYLDEGEDAPQLFAVADASVSGKKPKRTKRAVSSSVAVADAPVTVTVPGVGKKRTRRLVIRDTRAHEVVTVIELLSPSNKEPGKDRDRYLDKRVEVLDSGTSFVEIDLLRGGQRMPMEGLPACDYYALVSRTWERPGMGLWPVGLRDPLPTVPIPLRRGEVEPLVALKPVLDRTYDEAGYAYRIYEGEPEPPLSAADAAWAKELLTAAGVTLPG
jgi:hypothetical protein